MADKATTAVSPAYRCPDGVRQGRMQMKRIRIEGVVAKAPSSETQTGLAQAQLWLFTILTQFRSDRSSAQRQLMSLVWIAECLRRKITDYGERKPCELSLAARLLPLLL